MIHNWKLDEIMEAVGPFEPGGHAIIPQTDTLTIVYRLSKLDIDRVVVSPWYGTLMDEVVDSDYRTFTLQIEDVDAAIIGFGIIEYEGKTANFTVASSVFRGKHAPPIPPANDPPAGSYHVVPFESSALQQTRDIHLYLPPDHDPSQSYPVIYMLDGQDVPEMGGGIDYLITEGILPSLIIVGTARAFSTPEHNVRGMEYVIGRNPEVFERHERFFAEEVPPWTEANYGASPHRKDRTVCGYSNGALLAVVLSVHYPELYGNVIALSAGAGQGFPDVFTISADTIQRPLCVYTSAGTQEPIFYKSTQQFAQDYIEAGATVVFRRNVASHSYHAWQTELVRAVRWIFDQ